MNAEKPHNYALFWHSGWAEIIKNLSKVVQDFAQLPPKVCRFSAQLVQDRAARFYKKMNILQIIIGTGTTYYIRNDFVF